MKKTIIALLALCSCIGVKAQENKIFHFGIGLNAGTNGAGLDASIGLTRFIQIRGGFSYFPQMDFNYKTKIYNEATQFIGGLNLNPAFADNIIPEIGKKTQVKIQPNIMTYHALLDLYPAGSFHFTVGAYFGEENIVRMYNLNHSMKPAALANGFIAQYNATNPQIPISPVGIHMGDYVFTPDANGDVDVEMHVKKMRPYFGIGFGRAVPRKSRVGMSLDLGVQYWDKPTYYCNGEVVEPSAISTGDEKIVGTLSNLPIYPVVTLRIAGRII